MLKQYSNFFAEKVFDEQLYDMSDKIHSYKDYAAGKLGKDHRKAAAPATVMRVLRRGRSRRVDMFLDWLVSIASVVAETKLTQRRRRAHSQH